MHRHLRSLIVAGLFASTAPGVARAQEAVLLRLAPPVGQVSRYQIAMDIWIQSPMLPLLETEGPTMHMEMFTTQTVAGIDGDVRDIKFTIDSMQLNSPLIPEGEGMPGLGGIEATMKMDPRGRVLETAIADSALPPELQQSFSMMQQGLTGTNLELPEGSIRPGDTWETSQDIPIPMAPGMEMGMEVLIKYVFERLERRAGARHAVISLSGTLAQGTPPEAAPMPMEMSFSGSTDGEMVLDLDAGRIASSQVNMLMDGQFEAQGEVVPMIMNMEVKLKLLGGS